MVQNYVVGLAFDKPAQKVALIEKRRPIWQVGKLNGVGGKLEFGELPVDAMVREFYEEAGVITETTDWHYMGSLSRPNDFKLYVFRMFSDDVHEVSSQTDEVVSLYNVDLNRFMETGVANLAWLLAAALDPTCATFKLGVEYDKESDLTQE